MTRQVELIGYNLDRGGQGYSLRIDWVATAAFSAGLIWAIAPLVTVNTNTNRNIIIRRVSLSCNFAGAAGPTTADMQITTFNASADPSGGSDYLGNIAFKNTRNTTAPNVLVARQASGTAPLTESAAVHRVHKSFGLRRHTTNEKQVVYDWEFTITGGILIPPSTDGTDTTGFGIRANVAMVTNDSIHGGIEWDEYRA